MRSNPNTFGSIFQTKDDDRGCDRVLRSGFWLPSPRHDGATPIALDAIRDARSNRAR
jgi:hypothetical protein